MLRILMQEYTENTENSYGIGKTVHDFTKKLMLTLPCLPHNVNAVEGKYSILIKVRNKK